MDTAPDRNKLRVIINYMEGGSLMDIFTANLMTEGQIVAVLKGTCQGPEHLRRRGVTHHDTKNENILLSLHGGIKLGALSVWMGGKLEH